MTNFFLAALALTAALTYVAAALSLKRAAELGAGIWHSTFVCNILAAVIFQGLLVFEGHWEPLSLWWQPFVVALLFLSGQAWTLVSLQKGDVSVATPVLGLKIILVAVFTTLILGQGLPWYLWLAAVLSTGGIAVLNYSGASKEGGGAKTGRTIIYALCAAVSFALFDVLVQKWSPVWGIGRFLPLAVGMTGCLSFTILPLFPAPLHSLPRPAKTWLLGGGSLFALQSLLFVSGIAYFKQATASNVIYSSRGVWSIVAVAVLGHLFHNTEKAQGGSVLRQRFIGAALMFAAIVLILAQPSR